MSCEATPAHASESFEWRIRQHSAEKNSPVNCFSRGSARLAVQRGGAAENCFIKAPERELCHCVASIYGTLATGLD